MVSGKTHEDVHYHCNVDYLHIDTNGTVEFTISILYHGRVHLSSDRGADRRARHRYYGVYYSGGPKDWKDSDRKRESI